MAQTVNQLRVSAFGARSTEVQMQPGQEESSLGVGIGVPGARDGMSRKVLSLCPRTAASSLWQPWCLTPADLAGDGDVEGEAASLSRVLMAQGEHALQLPAMAYSRSVASSCAPEQMNEVPSPEALPQSLGSRSCLFLAQK